MNLIERYRGDIVRAMTDNATFQADWPARKAFLLAELGAPGIWTPARVVGLGSRLKDLFRTRAPGAATGRTQGNLSAAGNIWETLVAYYLNLCYAGTDVIAMRRPGVPPAVRDALRAWYGPASLSPDVDGIALSIPGASTTAAGTSRAARKRDYESLWADAFASGRVVLMACKTNWNDSVQTPVLWNMLYQARRSNALPPGISIGTGTYSIDQLAGFAFAFVTEPSNQVAGFANGSAPVERAKTMTGDYFWGRPSVPNVCVSMEEFFGRQAPRVGFPSPGLVGVATANEANASPGVVDLAAFDLP